MSRQLTCSLALRASQRPAMLLLLFAGPVFAQATPGRATIASGAPATIVAATGFLPATMNVTGLGFEEPLLAETASAGGRDELQP